MAGKEITTLRFKDAESKEQSVAIVRTSAAAVGLCLSVEKDGDVEVFLSVADCKKLIEALQEAIRTQKS